MKKLNDDIIKKEKDLQEVKSSVARKKTAHEDEAKMRVRESKVSHTASGIANIPLKHAYPARNRHCHHRNVTITSRS